MDIQRLADLQLERTAARKAKLTDFYDPSGSTRFLIMQTGPCLRCDECNSVKQVVENNLRQLAGDLAVTWTDELPYLEPWLGTGVYANAFGCEYVWREGAAPHVHYKYMKIDELRNVAKPDWRNSPLLLMVLDAIDALKEAGADSFPIALTDTQSAFDTATLILDAVEFFASCHEEAELAAHFMNRINELVAEFSAEQLRRIGPALAARPGHIMPSFAGGPGIAVSDDNLAVASPHINETFSLPCNKRLAGLFGGVAIHSCGPWHHTMRKAFEEGGALMVDCALHKSCDPCPNQPAAVRDALKGLKKPILKIRLGGSLEEIEALVEEVFDPSLKLVVHIPLVKDDEERRYKRLQGRLEKLYAH
ncbi:MAG: uroporphyrinogen decarboxylase family protein [Lentisphaeria bacterium]